MRGATGRRGYHGLRHRHGRPGASNYNYYSRSAAAAAAESVRRRELRGCRGPFGCLPERGAAQQTAVRFQDGPRGGRRLVSWDAGRAGERPTTPTTRLAAPIQRSGRTRVFNLGWRCACTTVKSTTKFVSTGQSTMLTVIGVDVRQIAGILNCQVGTCCMSDQTTST